MPTRSCACAPAMRSSRTSAHSQPRRDPRRRSQGRVRTRTRTSARHTEQHLPERDEVTMSIFAGARVWLPVYLMLTIAAGFVDLRVRRYPDLGMTKYVSEVVTGSAEAPGLYRVLT